MPLKEKNLKKWNRKWNIELIEKENKNWNDLAENWINQTLCFLDSHFREKDKQIQKLIIFNQSN